MDSILIRLLLILSLWPNIEMGKQEEWEKKAKLLTDKKFINGKSEIVFLLDRSGSIGTAGFEEEKGFVSMLLGQFVISPNATRVAVITYSSDVVTHIDYLKTPKNRCFFAQELLQVQFENSRATNIAAALKEARKVLKNARPGVRKVVILLSDGLSTEGGDPQVAAKKLIDNKVDIFAFGVGTIWKHELRRLASSDDHIFYCSDFKEFRQLAEVIRGDPHEKVWSFDDGPRGCDSQCNSPYRGSPDDPGCCDHSAKCSCSLQSGHRTCVCGPGYYGMSGLKGQCKPCPFSTYKDQYELTDRCQKCPVLSTTENSASTSISNCKCITGYEGDPSKGIPCTIKECPPLQEPNNGHRIAPCNNKYKSSCFFGCNKGYELQKANSRQRTCQDSKEWSGSTAVCQKIRCREPIAPRFGNKTCSSKDFTVGTICNFSCDPGYIPVGAKQQKCQPNKKWKPAELECIAVTCPSFQPKKNLIFAYCEPGRHYEYNDACLFKCPKGFEMVGSSSMVCYQNGKWRGENGETTQPFCKDIQPPDIHCPPDLILQTDKGKNYTQFYWSKPAVSDNSGFEPVLSWNPLLKQPAKLYMGVNRIKFKASDKTGLTATCETTITVEDREPPRIKLCPKNIEVNTSDFEIEVSWKVPEFWDNSHRKVKISTTAFPGTMFPPGKHNVIYIAKDQSNNVAECFFNVMVSKTSCPYHPPPVNGAIACNYWRSGEFCEVHCNEEFEFSSDPADHYICDATNEWKTIPFDYPIPWPDCGERSTPNRVKMVVRRRYFSGNCHDPKVREAIKKSYMQGFREKFNTDFCTNKGECMLDSVKVTCGKTNYTINMRAKRDVWRIPIDDTLEIEVEIMVSNEKNNDADVNELLTAIDEIVNNMKEWKPPADGIDSDTMLQDALFFDDADEPVFICYPGAVLKNEDCVNCPVGSYHNRYNSTCDECPVGYYQDEEASVECIACPNGTWTEDIGSKNITDCKEICVPGTYSSTGLATCMSCPTSTYQPFFQQTYCIACPENTTTAIEGVDNENDCLEMCPPGSYSDTGLQPCLPCSLGTFQEEYGQLDCKTCPGNLTTADIGTHSDRDCIDYNHCSSNPCFNSAECVSDQYNFFCICLEGFSGKYCEEDIDDCQYSLCAEGSTCIDGVATYSCHCPPGFSGNVCDEEDNECESRPCQNYGVCVDEVAKFQCLCLPGYEGQFCEIDVDLCQKYPCANGAHCEEVDNNRKCTCHPGFEGEDCSINIDDCIPLICQNGGSCVDGILNYTCSCALGFVGTYCEINVDECFNHLCQNGATCIDGINSYICFCPPGYSGIYCEQKLSSNFMMSFDNPSTSNYAMVNNLPPMSSTSIEMWVQTTEQNQGTMLSYAANNQFQQQVPNALTMTDYGSLKIYVNDKPIYTGLKLNDGHWHHIAFTWSSKDGSWKLYHNGSVLASGEGIKTGEMIPGGGFLIVGQEQDCVGGDFSSIEAFTGNISRVNVWGKVLSQQDIQRLCRFKEIPGPVTAWPDFQSGINGNIRITNSDIAWESNTNSAK